MEGKGGRAGKREKINRRIDREALPRPTPTDDASKKEACPLKGFKIRPVVDDTSACEVSEHASKTGLIAIRTSMDSPLSLVAVCVDKTVYMFDCIDHRELCREVLTRILGDQNVTKLMWDARDDLKNLRKEGIVDVLPICDILVEFTLYRAVVLLRGLHTESRANSLKYELCSYICNPVRIANGEKMPKKQYQAPQFKPRLNNMLEDLKLPTNIYAKDNLKALVHNRDGYFAVRPLPLLRMKFIAADVAHLARAYKRSSRKITQALVWICSGILQIHTIPVKLTQGEHTDESARLNIHVALSFLNNHDADYPPTWDNTTEYHLNIELVGITTKALIDLFPSDLRAKMQEYITQTYAGSCIFRIDIDLAHPTICILSSVRPVSTTRYEGQLLRSCSTRTLLGPAIGEEFISTRFRKRESMATAT